MTQQQQKKPWWTSLISEVGGAGGLAAGAALAPETGGLSLLLPALGAAAGAFTGRVAENKVRDNRLGLGDAAKEGAISGLTAGLAGGYDAYKTGKAAQGLANLATDEGSNVARSGIKGILPNIKQGIAGFGDSALQAPDKVGLLESVGKNFKAGAGGYGTGATAAGEQQLTAQASDQIGNTLKTLGIGNGAPEAQARTLGEKINNLAGILTSKYSKANVPITTEEINNLGSNILGRVSATQGLGDTANKFALDETQKLVSNANDVGGLWSAIKDLARNSTNFAASGDAKLADKEGAARIILDEARGFLNAKVPGLAETNSLYHDATSAQSFLLNGAKDSKGNLTSRLLSSGPVKGAESKAGGLLETLGRASAGTGGPATQFTNALKLQLPGAFIRNSGAQQQPPDSLLQASGPTTGPNSQLGAQQPGMPGQSANSDLLGQANGGDTTGQLLGQQPAQASGGPSLGTLKQAIAEDMQTTGGKNINNLMQLAQLYGLVDNSGSVGGAKLTTDQQKTVDSANEASATLDTMLSQLGQLGGGAGRVGGLLGAVQGKLGLNNNVNAFNSTKTDTAIALAKAYSGSTRLPSPQSLKAIEASMPSYEDNPQEAQRKVDLIKQRLAAKLNSIPGGQALNNISGSQDLLSQLNGQ